MKVFRSARWLLLALLLPLIPAPKANAGVFISVNFGPPVLPVYVQPPCPEPDLIWTPGYWAYGPDGYYWVPGAWVPAPYVGALWTPPYWGFSGGAYLFHPGYWGPHVGYYGGINYGFGYMGVGFVGGMWGGGHFRYNTAIVNVNRTYIRNVYVDRTIVQRNTIMNRGRVAYNGGPNGVRYQASAQERSYMNERRTAPTSFQTQHVASARADRTAYARSNGGRPNNLVANRPLQRETQSRPMTAARPNNSFARPSTPASRPAFNQPRTESRPTAPASRPSYNSPASRPTYNQPRQESRPTYSQPRQESRPTYSQPRQQSRPAPQQREARPAPQRESRPASRPEPRGRR